MTGALSDKPEGMLGKAGEGIARRLSGSTLTIPSRDSTRLSVPLTIFTRRLPVEVTKKVSPIWPSSDP